MPFVSVIFSLYLTTNIFYWKRTFYMLFFKSLLKQTFIPGKGLAMSKYTFKKKTKWAENKGTKRN